MQNDSTCNNFGSALKTVRALKGRTQEDFWELSSRTYVSALERGLKSPTLSKVDELAQVLGVHPLTLLTVAYTADKGLAGVTAITELVGRELDDLRKVG